MLKSIRALLYVALITGNAGCANPQTRIWGGPFGWGFSDSKDNDVELAKAGFNKETGEFSLEGLKIVNNASAVRRANVEQIRAGYEGAALLFPAMLDAVLARLPALKQFAPAATLSGPLGGAVSLPPEVLKPIAEAAAQAVLEKIGGLQTRPTNDGLETRPTVLPANP
ncbi:MAG: hypothetical protein E6Q97_15820 [Desulfurellales bacterium]|nr:MAG: hypothetical protein E6Q97_15820 [Desulfurellales bacterium]